MTTLLHLPTYQYPQVYNGLGQLIGLVECLEHEDHPKRVKRMALLIKKYSPDMRCRSWMGR